VDGFPDCRHRFKSLCSHNLQVVATAGAKRQLVRQISLAYPGLGSNADLTVMLVYAASKLHAL
jgi:hypothetical protein